MPEPHATEPAEQPTEHPAASGVDTPTQTQGEPVTTERTDGPAPSTSGSERDASQQVEPTSDPEQVEAWANVEYTDRSAQPARKTVNTSGTLAALEQATPEDWLGSNKDPDVMLAVPNLGIDHIGLEVDNLRAHLQLHAKVLDLVQISVGADVYIERVELNIDNVRAQAMLKVKLEKVAEIVTSTLDVINQHPEILTNLTQGLGQGVQGALEGPPQPDPRYATTGPERPARPAIEAAESATADAELAAERSETQARRAA